MSTTRKRLTGPIHGRIKRLRERLGLSLTDFGEKVGVHVSVVCHWEHGRARPDISRVPALAAALGVTELQLVRGEPGWAPYERMLRKVAA